MKSKLIILSVSFVFLAVFLILQLISFSDGKLHIVFCNVGQGDGIYIRTPKGSDIVIDAGRNNSIIKCLENHMPFWDRSIELVFATHPDADHIAGFVYILNSYSVKSYNTVQLEKNTEVFEEINRILKDRKIPTRFLTKGDIYKLDSDISLKAYWPSKDFIEKGDSDSNRYSLVQILEYRDFDTLFTGDIDFDILNSIFSKGIDAELFKLPHHGSKTGIDSKTFTLIHPRISIISAGKNNSYGHPHKEVLNELEKYNLEYLNTAKAGEIEIVTDGKTAKIIQ